MKKSLYYCGMRRDVAPAVWSRSPTALCYPDTNSTVLSRRLGRLFRARRCKISAAPLITSLIIAALLSSNALQSPGHLLVVALNVCLVCHHGRCLDNQKEYDGTKIASTAKVTNDHLDGDSMRFLRSMSKATDLTDSEGNIGPGVGRQIQ